MRVHCYILLILLQLLRQSRITDSARILVYCPSISKSHILLCGKYADVLHNDGHDTVLFIPTYSTSLDSYNGAKYAKVWRLFNISDAFEKGLSSFSGILEDSSIGLLERLEFEYNFFIEMCEALANQLTRMENLASYNFDVALVGDVDYCNHGIVRSLGIRNIILLSSEPIMDKISWDLGLPFPTSYVPSVEENANHDQMQFFDRMLNSYKYFSSIVVHYVIDYWLQNIFPNSPSPIELIKNVSLVLVNSNEMFDLARPISPKIVYVGLLESESEEQELPKNLEQLFENNGKVIYVSFGTVSPISILPDKIKFSIYYAVSQLPNYQFIIKKPKDDFETQKLFANLSNVIFADWVPQAALLRKKTLKLFISHGGMNSILESMTYGVPTLVMPVFTDQFRNAKNVERRGAGRMILRGNIERETFFYEISQIVENQNYHINANRISKLIQTRPFSPKDRVLKWVNFTINHQPADIMYMEANNLSIWQYFYIDLFFYATVILFLTRKAFQIIGMF